MTTNGDEEKLPLEELDQIILKEDFARRSVWLVEVSDELHDYVRSCPENAQLGELIMHKRPPSGREPMMTLNVRVREDPDLVDPLKTEYDESQERYNYRREYAEDLGDNIPLEYDMVFGPQSRPAYLFSIPSREAKNSVQGNVGRWISARPKRKSKPQIEKYRNYVGFRTKLQQKRAKIGEIEEIDAEQEIKDESLGQKQEAVMAQYRKHKEENIKNKKVKMSEEELNRAILEAFSVSQHWSLPALADRIDQNKSKVKDVLKKWAFVPNTGEHRGFYQLKDEFAIHAKKGGDASGTDGK
eukprot:Clim_evm2s114 gene=Clim_evmTU2s114